MEGDENYVTKNFRCRACNETHKVKFDKRIIEGRTKFPFPYVFLHDNKEHKELITILYVDKNLSVRHSEIQELGTDLLFSKEQVVALTKPLLEEIELLRDELEKAKAEIYSMKRNG